MHDSMLAQAPALLPDLTDPELLQQPPGIGRSGSGPSVATAESFRRGRGRQAACAAAVDS